MKTITHDAFTFEVDYRRTFTEMVRASAQDWDNPGVLPSIFSIRGEGIVRVTASLRRYGVRTSTNKILQDMQERGRRPGNIEHILAIAEKWPDEQRKYPIVALASARSCYPREGSNVAALREYSGRRALCVFWDVELWKSPFCFLEIIEEVPA